MIVESFWGVYVAGVTYRLSTENMMKVLEATQSGRDAKSRDLTNYSHLVEVRDIFNSTVYIDAKGVTSIYESNPQQREKEAVHTEYLNKSPNGFE